MMMKRKQRKERKQRKLNQNRLRQRIIEWSNKKIIQFNQNNKKSILIFMNEFSSI